MFCQRTSSQKPGSDLLANFRQQFPEVAVVRSSTAAPGILQTIAGEKPILPAAPLPDRSQGLGQDAFRNQDPTPRATDEPWRFTPSLLDPNSMSFASFANAPPGYYTPTPSSTNTLFHPQAGNLQTPTMGLGMGLGTQLSMPNSGDVMQSVPGPAVIEMAGFQPLPAHPFHHFNPFIQGPLPQQSFAPSTFVHQDTVYETMDSEPSEERMSSIGATLQKLGPMMELQTRQFPRTHIAHQLPPAEKFRFHCTLNAPTAMIKQSDEIPVTYLNKGHAYSLCVADTNSTLLVAPGTRYRTFVRVSFEDEQQRQRPGVCWGLWKDEAHQRGGKLQAVEFVEAGQPAEGDGKRICVELETSSFDGFSVIWTPGINGSAEVNIAVRFNFLSTDFSHSKGVKGIPVRLCAKTNPVPWDSSRPAADANPETCFCKVKLFRDHGAERKLSNDVAHVNKSIDKLKQQIAQAESGLKDFGKRKRSSGAARIIEAQRPGKVQEHKRTWFMSSASSAGGGGGGRPSMEEDLHYKLQTLQYMFTRPRPVSILYLRGEELDDPDLHPVSLPGDVSPLTKPEGQDGSNWQARSGHSSVTGSMIYPSPSSLSLISQASGIGSGGQRQGFDSIGPSNTSRKGSEAPTKVSKIEDDGSLNGWIEALGVDASYRSPLEPAPKPVACLYILRRTQGSTSKPDYHRAIYLMQRSLKELNNKIAAKWDLDPSKILRPIHSIQNSLDVEMDDDDIQELREGQDMVLEIEEVSGKPADVKQEWGMAVDPMDDLTEPPANQQVGGYVLRLAF
ncbi:CP2 transcription factor-domain-containing protein [Fusarium oxysporum]|nr:CP2 transcription factor-domain-containing protein [Fusarium oxysporum]